MSESINFEDKGSLYSSVVIVVVILFAALFYWYEYRPSQIRKECARIANSESAEDKSGSGAFDYLRFVAKNTNGNEGVFNQNYQKCLVLRGLSVQ